VKKRGNAKTRITGNYRKLPEITGNYRKLPEIPPTPLKIFYPEITRNYRKLPEITGNFPPWVLGHYHEAGRGSILKKKCHSLSSNR
jgi:hypothetical protein